MEERFCKKCGKIFVPAPYHIYRDKNGFYCTWTCYNHRETVKRTKSIATYTKNGELLRVYNSASQAAEYLGVSIWDIYDACKNGNIFLDCYWKYEEREKQDYE